MTPHQKEHHRSLLLVLQVPFRQMGDRLLVETQAGNGLERWADNFGSVTVAAPTLTAATIAAEGLEAMDWQETTSLAGSQRFQFVPLPRAANLAAFWQHFSAGRAQLSRLVAQHRYLQFAMGSLIGDWATVAAWEAIAQQRDYAIHADWVEHETYLQGRGPGWQARCKAEVMSQLIAVSSRHIIQKAKLGLWHGASCYNAYHALCPHSFLIHNIHTKPTDLIRGRDLTAKLARCQQDPVLRVCYVGRMAAMKAPLDWVQAIARARDLGVRLAATWIGEGNLRPAMAAAIRDYRLEGVVTLLGFERDRQEVMRQIRAAHLMLFTHVTPESPRCLIESLINGTPIVGYGSAYAQDLIAKQGGGCLVPCGDWSALGTQLQILAADRAQLEHLTQAAALSGSRFTDEAVFQERSDLIKRYLQQPAPVEAPHYAKRYGRISEEGAAN